jgi:tetratricopeptide (TPR) repeat protein
LGAVVQLIGKAVFPVNQSVFPIIQDSPLVYGFAAIAAVAALVLFKKGSRGLVVFGAAWMILFLVPPLVRPHGAVITDVLEHRLYLPILGLIMMIADLDFIKGAHGIRRKALAAFGIIVLCVFFAKTYFYSDNFKSAVIFWDGAVKASPHSAYAHMKLGELYYENGEISKSQADMNKARSEISEAMKLDYHSSLIGHYYLGLIHLKKEELKEAVGEFEKAIALYPAFYGSYVALGTVYYKYGRPDDACRMWETAVALKSDCVDAIRNLAIYYSEKQDFVKSRLYVERLRRLGVEPPEEFMKTIGVQ